MKKTRLTLFALILVGTFAGSTAASAAVAADIHIGPSGRATVDLGFFYDDLSPYGHWVDRPSYGWVWTPRAVATTWRPYQNGHWAWTDEGWIWITTEPYGWATYHYGRWYEDPDYGWSWVPGNEYAPAWVSWQEGGDYIGWAPLPPSVEFRAGPLSVSLSPDAYLFVPTRRFLDPNPYRYAVPRQDRDRIYHQTRSFTDYQIVNQRIVNRGVPVDQIQRVVGRRVPRYQVTEMNANQRHQGARVSGNRLNVFRPEVQKAQVAPPPQRQVAKRSVLTAPPATAPGRGNNRPDRPAVAGPVPEMKGPQARKPKPQQQPQAPAVARQTPPGQAGRQNRQKAPRVEPVPQAEAKPQGRQRPAREPRQEQAKPEKQKNVQPQDRPRGNSQGNRRQNAEQQAPPPRPQPKAAPQQDRPARQAAPREQPQQPRQQAQPRGQQGQGQPRGQQDRPNQGGGGKGGGKGHNKPENDKKPPTG